MVQIKDLCSLRFIENRENLFSHGILGAGKTHLSTAIGVEAASTRYLTYFISCYDLIQNLRKEYDENRLEERLKHYNKYRALMISSNRIVRC